MKWNSRFAALNGPLLDECLCLSSACLRFYRRSLANSVKMIFLNSNRIFRFSTDRSLLCTLVVTCGGHERRPSLCEGSIKKGPLWGRLIIWLGRDGLGHIHVPAPAAPGACAAPDAPGIWSNPRGPRTNAFALRRLNKKGDPFGVPFFI